MKKFLIFVLFAIVIGGAAAFSMYARVNEPYRGFDGTEQFVDIPGGAGSRAIGDRLAAAGIVRRGSARRRGEPWQRNRR